VADIVLLDIDGRVATVTLNRPEARNALSTAMIRALTEVTRGLDADDDVDVVVLTGVDPAFCAGLDLKELGVDGGPLKGSGAAGGADRTSGSGGGADGTGSPGERRGRQTGLATSKPVIGAVNGAAVTGGLELALNCDFLVASERAVFADTHARVGVHPLWGLTVLLPQAVGIRRAREMSATGNFIDGATALAWGLVNHVVPHDQLVPVAQRLAADMASSDQRALRAILATYEATSAFSVGEGWEVEGRAAAAFQGGGVDPAEIERRRRSVVDRGRTQI
jgi:enoyl-CoA hydratase